MRRKNSNFGEHGMMSKRTNKRKKAYRSPRLVVYGDFRRLTKGSTGLSRDGGGGAGKSKASGGA